MTEGPAARAAAPAVRRTGRRTAAKGVAATAGAAAVYATPVARAVHVARAQQAGSPPPVTTPVTAQQLRVCVLNLGTQTPHVQFSLFTLRETRAFFLEPQAQACHAFTYPEDWLRGPFETVDASVGTEPVQSVMTDPPTALWNMDITGTSRSNVRASVLVGAGLTTLTVTIGTSA